MFKIKYNQKNSQLPNYILFFMACYVSWQMGIIWLDANNSVLASAGTLSNQFMSNLSSFCGLISIITIIVIGFKPKYAYKSCIIATIISIITTLALLTNSYTEECLLILVGSCSVMSLTSTAIYFYTYNSSNLKKQILIEMLGVIAINLLFHSDFFKLSFIYYNLTSLALLILFLIGLLKIMNLEISFKLNKENNSSLYLGATTLLILFNMVGVFGANIVNQIKYGNTFFYTGGLIGFLLFILLNKSNIKKTYIPSIYISIFLLSLTFLVTPILNIGGYILLGVANSFYFALPYYCNLVYKNTFSRFIYLIYNLVGIIQVIILDLVINLTNNNLDSLIAIYMIISSISLCAMFIIGNQINQKIDHMLKLEKKETLFKELTNAEIEVANLLVKNYTNSEIAKTLYLSENTIKFHVKSILKKLDVANRKELIFLLEN